MLKISTRLVLALLLLLPFASCGKKSNPALIGEWEGKINSKTVSLTFEKDGQLIWGGDIASLGNIFTAFSLLTDFGSRPGRNTPITYQCISDTQVEVEGDFSVMLEKLSGGGRGDGKLASEAMQMLHPKETLTFAVAGKELTLTNKLGKSTKLQRVDSTP